MQIRKGQGPGKLTRVEFGRRFLKLFDDPLFEAASPAVAQLQEIAWSAYQQSRKAPLTRPAGAGFVDPTYETSVEWLENPGKNSGSKRPTASVRNADARARDQRSGPQRQDVSGENSKSEPFARANQRLDERDLRALGARARRARHHAPVLVSSAVGTKTAHRPHGLRGWWQSGPQLDSREEARARQRARARRLALSEAPCRPRLRSGRAWRRRWGGEPAPLTG